MSTYRTLSDLQTALEFLPQNLPVFIDNRPPTALSSYRGYYDHLAIERDGSSSEATELREPNEVAIKSAPTVGDLVEALDLADGATLVGYKGGDYSMGPWTDLWVSEYGRAESLRVIAVEALPDRVDLLTEEVDW